MASQHSFPTGYPNTQQNAMRMHFVGGPMMPGLVAPQQSKSKFKLEILYSYQ